MDADPVLLAEAERLEKPVQYTERGVENRELPDQRRGGRHDQERADDQRAEESAPEDVPVEQDRDTDSEGNGEQDGHDREQQGVEDRDSEDVVVEDCPVVVERRKILRSLRVVEVVLLEAVPECQQERDLRNDESEDQRRNQRQPPNPGARTWLSCARFCDRWCRLDQRSQRPCPSDDCQSCSGRGSGGALREPRRPLGGVPGVLDASRLRNAALVQRRYRTTSCTQRR